MKPKLPIEIMVYCHGYERINGDLEWELISEHKHRTVPVTIPINAYKFKGYRMSSWFKDMDQAEEYVKELTKLFK